MGGETKKTQDGKPSWKFVGSRPHFFICVIGVYSVYLYYGILQERILRDRHGVDEFSRVFKQWDANSDGVISDVEMVEAVERIGLDWETDSEGKKFPLNKTKAEEYLKLEVPIRLEEFESMYRGEVFPSTLGLLFVQCIINTLIAAIALYMSGAERKPSPFFDQFKISFTFVLSMFCSNYALKFVNFPTAVVGKSVKMLPVMAIEVIRYRRKYSSLQYILVFLITSGVTLFNYFKPGKAGGGENSYIGLLLLVGSLILDGNTGPAQLTSTSKRKMKEQYGVSKYQLMTLTNLWAIFIMLAGLLLTQEALPTIAFLQRHPYTITNVLLFGFLSGIGQLFVFNLVADFSPLICTLVTTIRKFCTFFVSVLMNGHHMTQEQWMGAGFVFFGVLLWEVDSQLSKQKKAKKAD